MRSASSLVLVVAVGCAGSELDQPIACEVGPNLVPEYVSAFQSNSPRCTSDADCATTQTDVSCHGFGYHGCPVVVHESLVGTWSDDALCDELGATSKSSNVGCDTQVSCAATRVVCSAGVCTSKL